MGADGEMGARGALHDGRGDRGDWLPLYCYVNHEVAAVGRGRGSGEEEMESVVSLTSRLPHTVAAQTIKIPLSSSHTHTRKLNRLRN